MTIKEATADIFDNCSLVSQGAAACRVTFTFCSFDDNLNDRCS